MNKRKLAYEAAQWVILCRDESRLDEQQFAKLIRWLSRSKWHVAAFREAARVHERVGRLQLAAPTSASSQNVISLWARAERSTPYSNFAVSVSEGIKQPFLMTRRRLLASVASCLTAAATLKFVSDATSRDVIGSGHVVRVPLRDGVMHVGRHTSFRVGGDTHAQIVHLLEGQAAVHLWAGSRRFSIVQTPLCEIIVSGARFALVVLESMVKLTVAEGAIHVAVPSRGSASPSIVPAGHQLTLRRGTSTQELISVADPEREFSWVRGELVLDGLSIAEAAALFNRFNEVRIEPSPEVGYLAVSSYRCGLNDPERFVDRVVADWGLVSRVDETGAGKVIRVLRGDVAPGRRDREEY